MDHGVTCPLVHLSCAWPGANLISPYVGVIYYAIWACSSVINRYAQGIMLQDAYDHKYASLPTGHSLVWGCNSISLAWCFMSDWGLCWTGFYWTLSYLCILAGDFLSHYPLAKCGLLCCQTPNDRTSWWGNWENWVKKKMVSHKTCTPSVCLSFSLFLWGKLRARESFLCSPPCLDWWATGKLSEGQEKR